MKTETQELSGTFYIKFQSFQISPILFSRIFHVPENGHFLSKIFKAVRPLLINAQFKKLDTGPQQVHFAYHAQVTRANSFPPKNYYHFSLHQFVKFRDLLQAHTPVWRPFFRVSQYQKGKIDLEFTEARDSEWQWHQLGHMQVCTLLQTDNHASTPPIVFLQHQSTEGNLLQENHQNSVHH